MTLEELQTVRTWLRAMPLRQLQTLARRIGLRPWERDGDSSRIAAQILAYFPGKALEAWRDRKGGG